MRLAILLSGRGSNFQAIHEAVKRGALDADIALVISNRPDAPGIERAREYGFPRRGDVATHTGDFGPNTGTLRLDYVLPSKNLPVRGGGVFWPKKGEPGSELLDASDHHLVWLDIGPR